MTNRKIACLPRFCNKLKRLEKKYAGFQDIVHNFLKDCREKGPPQTSRQIPGVGMEGVYKDRLKLPQTGKRGGARIIYYCDQERVVASAINSKKDRPVSVQEIQKELRAVLDLPEVDTTESDSDT